MHAHTHHPPALPPPGRASRRLPAVVWAGFGVGLAMVVARGIAVGRVPYPQCGFKHLTSLPCPGCGGTRSLVALGQGDVAAALAWNPLVAAGALLMVIAAAVALADHSVSGGRIARTLRARLRWTRAVSWLLGALILANWAYLVVFLR